MPPPFVPRPRIKRKLNEIKEANEIDGHDTSQINSSKRQKTNAIHPCPVGEKYNCQKTFSCKGSADRHAAVHNADRGRVPCPLAKKYNCKQTFLQRADATRDSKLHESKRFPCPLAKKHERGRDFASKKYANRHAKLHEGKRFPCPLARKYQCGRDFASRDNAKEHAKLHQDEGKRLSCPQAKECNCEKTFSTTKAAKRHFAKHHQKPHSTNPQQVQSRSIRKNPRIHPRSSQQAPCPLAEKYDCKRTFITPKNAYLHAKIHVRNPEHRFSCPSAEIHHCEKTFATEVIAKAHGMVHTRERNIPCPVAEKFNCATLLCSKSSANRHSEIHIGPWKICTVPMCRDAIARVPFVSYLLERHLKTHRERGDVELLQKYPPPFVDVNVMRQAEMLEEEIIINEGEMLEEEGIIDEGEMLEDTANPVTHYFPADQIFSDSHREMIRETNKSFRSMGICSNAGIKGTALTFCRALASIRV